jgi:hypothetical protein
MREHRGYLYLGGLENNRIGRIKLDPAHCDPTWTGLRGLLGQQAASVIDELSHVPAPRPRTDIFKDRDPHAIPSMDGAFRSE